MCTLIIIIVVVVVVHDDTYYWVYLSSNHLFQVYYKVRQVLLQSATGITKCDNFIKKCDRYYKVRRLLQSATVHTMLFCTFLCPFLLDYDVKMPNFAFYGGRKQATTKFSLTVLGYGA